jgi:hypothetical protein
MKKLKFNYRKLAALCAVLTIILLQSAAHSIAAGSPSLASTSADADLSSEGRTLDSFVDELSAFDKRHAELSKKASLTRLEFEAHQRNANTLKNRVSAVQNALQDIIRKLKAAGQWDNLDAIILAKTSDSRFQDLARRESFKRLLEAASTGLSAEANEISAPLDSLRNQLKGQAHDNLFTPGNSSLALRAIPVAYHPAPAVFAASFRCRLSYLRLGISMAVTKDGKGSKGANDALNCNCFGSCSAT